MVGQVQLDMQLMAKLHELKHQHDKQSNSAKERDRALISLKNREDLINKLRVQIPVLTQERDGVSREVPLITHKALNITVAKMLQLIHTFTDNR